MGGTTFDDAWRDDFDDGSTSGWDRINHTESGGTMNIQTGTEKHSNTNDFAALPVLTGATEWAYVFRVYAPSSGTYATNRTARLLLANDIRLQLFKGYATDWEMWVGSGDYSTNAKTWNSNDEGLRYAFNTWYEIGIHKLDGLNAYNIYVNGVLQNAAPITSSTYDGIETPTSVDMGSGSSTVAFPAKYDYIAVGIVHIPEPVTVSLMGLGAAGMLLRRRRRR
ncbi:MAG: PEP-CTERM sorting domain-containing protein [Planctomycetaceae bacterium]|nr:PEP-CTERM sorting domain-containing protein [Planctomycetaceae bacterium]